MDGGAAGGTRADSAASWFRLLVCVLLGTIGGVGMWSVVVALPAVQAEFGAARAEASLPYTLTMLGFAFGGVATGRARRPLRRGAADRRRRSRWPAATVRRGLAAAVAVRAGAGR